MNQMRTIIKDFFTKNLGLKLLSVILALLLWLTVMNLSDPTISKTIEAVPVQVINEEVLTSRGYSYAIESGEKVDVRVKGRRTIVDSLTADDFTATADFNSFNKMYMATIDVACTHENADELELTLRTETMAVKLEDEATEARNITVNWLGEVKEDYYLVDKEKPELETSLITVTGAHSQVEKVREVVVDVPIDGKNAPFEDEYSLYAVDENGERIDPKKITLSQDSVKVNVIILPTKMITLNVVPTGKPAEHYYVDKCDYAPTQLLVAADSQTLSDLDELTISCDVNGKHESFDNFNDPFDIQKYLDKIVPSRCVAVESKTVNIMATILKKSKVNLSVTEDNLQKKGADDSQYMYDVVSLWNSGLTVWGREDELTNVETSDFDLYVDVTGYEPGTYSVQIQSDYSGELEIELGSVMMTVTKKVPVNPVNPYEGQGNPLNTENGGING